MNIKPYSLKLRAKCGIAKHARRVLQRLGLRKSSTELINLGESGIFLPSQLVAHIGEYRALKQYEEGGSCFTTGYLRFGRKTLEYSIIAKSGNNTKTGLFTYICWRISKSQNDGSRITLIIADWVIKHTFEQYRMREWSQVTWQNTHSKMRRLHVMELNFPRDLGELRQVISGLFSRNSYLY